jgi:hypothetical protein
MDSNSDGAKPSADNTSTVPNIQINPLTIMTSVPPFKPVDENQKNPLEEINIDIPLEMNLPTSLYSYG